MDMQWIDFIKEGTKHYPAVYDLAMTKLAGRGIKAYRSLLSALPGKPSGATAKFLKRNGVRPSRSPEDIRDLVNSDLRRIEDYLGYKVDSAELADAVFRHNTIIRNLDVLGELDPALRKKVVNNLRSAEPISRYRRYVHDDKYVDPDWEKGGPKYVRSRMEDNNPFRTEHIPDKKETLQRYNQLVGARVRNSLAYQRMDRRIASRFPIDMQEGEALPSSLLNIRRWLMSEAKRGRFRGVEQGRMSDLAERTKIRVDSGAERNMATTSSDYGAEPIITLSVKKDIKGHPYVNKDALRHEFGHVLTLHGTEDSGELLSIMRRLSPMGSINTEIMANEAGGLPKITPWTDTYYAASKDPKLILDAWRRYPYFKKPELPK